MAWRLTDEEIVALHRSCNSLELINSKTNMAMRHALADAQARRLVEEIAKHVLDRAYRIGFTDEVYLNGAFWEQLRKEVGLDAESEPD